MATDQKIISAAVALLDSGGFEAVTLRAVAQAVGVSHNAPYKHFVDRDALLAAVALRDFNALADGFAKVRKSRMSPLSKLKRVLTIFVAYAHDHPARYRLLFTDPKLPARGGEMKTTAMRSFTEFASIVQDCQDIGQLPAVPTIELASLIYASVHGLNDLAASGRLHKEKGLARVGDGIKLLLALLSRNDAPQDEVEGRGVRRQDKSAKRTRP